MAGLASGEVTPSAERVRSIAPEDGFIRSRSAAFVTQGAVRYRTLLSARPTTTASASAPPAPSTRAKSRAAPLVPSFGSAYRAMRRPS